MNLHIYYTAQCCFRKQAFHKGKENSFQVMPYIVLLLNEYYNKEISNNLDHGVLMSILWWHKTNHSSNKKVLSFLIIPVVSSLK